jgi:hypothetical protein
VAAPQREPRTGAVGASAADVLAPASALLRSRLGSAIAGVGLLTVVLVAARAPAAVRSPFVLVAALLLPGYPIVARMRLDLPTLLAIDVCTSLSLEALLALGMVEARLWHPQVLGLVLAVFGIGGTLVTLAAARHAGARHLQ